MATVVKVGGSLFDWPELGPRLRHFLTTLDTPRVLLIPGGGPTADVIRQLDRVHQLGEEGSHWLALRALTLNAHALLPILPGAKLVDGWEACPDVWQAGHFPILDAYAFIRADEGKSGCLPHRWSVTSDSVAVRVAVVGRARQLVLLKSVTIPEGTDWRKAAERGWVDECFATGVEEAGRGLDVRATNLRARGGGPPPPPRLDQRF